MLFTAVWICLPRMYYGIHYASDMVAGAAIGITVMWFALRTGWLRSRLASKVLAAADAAPSSVSCAVAFLASFEMATTFGDIRDLARALIHAARLGLHREIVTFALIAFSILGLAAGGACMVFLYRGWQNSARFGPLRGARNSLTSLQ
jgi:membrane-associated phospholipid phosphatase